MTIPLGDVLGYCQVWSGPKLPDRQSPRDRSTEVTFGDTQDRIRLQRAEHGVLKVLVQRFGVQCRREKKYNILSGGDDEWRCSEDA